MSEVNSWINHATPNSVKKRAGMRHSGNYIPRPLKVIRTPILDRTGEKILAMWLYNRSVIDHHLPILHPQSRDNVTKPNTSHLLESSIHYHNTHFAMPAPSHAQKANAARQDMSVILVTGSYDHEIRFWEAWSGICSRTIARSGESGVRVDYLLDVWDTNCVSC